MNDRHSTFSRGNEPVQETERDCYRHARTAVAEIEMLEAGIDSPVDHLKPFDGRIAKPNTTSPVSSSVASGRSEDVIAEQRYS